MVKSLEFSSDFLVKSKARIRSNNIVANFYRQKGVYEYSEDMFKHAKNIELCYKVWDVDYFRMNAVKDVKRVNLCKDLFCQNCQHNISLKRYAKYSPVLDDMSEQYDIYHLVFTVPSVFDYQLREILKKMYSKFVYVVQYFAGKRKSVSFDFRQFGYVGAVRSLEVTYNKVKNTIMYHPHFHCLFLFRKNLDFEKLNYNKYSFSRKRSSVKAFSDFELFLQKMWKLIYDGVTFNEKNFNKLKDGYSCSADKVIKNDYHEVFKYALGGIWKKDIPLTYEIFDTLLCALYRRKIIQGYGLLNKFEFDVDSDEEVINEYYAYRNMLEAFETPVIEVVPLNNIILDIDNGIKYISRFRKNYDEDN